MSAQSSQSSRAGSPAIPKFGVDEDALPSGNCRFILLNPEIKGQRCACVGFTLNRSQPGVTCLCGHASCYHVKSTEMDDMRRRIQVAEGAFKRLDEMMQRISDLEEQSERTREETSQELKDCYGNVNRMWISLDQLVKRQAISDNRFVSYDERLDTHDDTLQGLIDRMAQINEAQNEAQMALEERVEALEDQKLPSSSNTESEQTGQWPSRSGDTSRARPFPITHEVSRNLSGSTALNQAQKIWTVHVSLLPTAAQPFPFEKDTNAYKRCLSRGLHQMIPVCGSDSESFEAAIAKAFGSLLRGRPWMPLQARLCDAVNLQGLPMLRPLEPSLLDRPYDLEFLTRHCAVCHPSGKAESLYIAMVHDTLSWHFLRRSPCHLEGLEACWDYDSLLDPDDCLDGDTAGEEDRPPAGDIMLPFPSRKRTASEISRAPSFSSTGEADGSRSKVARMKVEACRHGVETT